MKEQAIATPFFARFKDPISGLTHLASALVAVVGTVFLLIRAGNARTGIVLVVYGASLVLLFSASAFYHLARTTPSRELLLRRVDHSAIFLLIAGTYTPICVLALPSPIGPILLIAVWAFAALGIVLKVFFFQQVPGWVSTTLYIVMGWLAVIGIVPLVRSIPIGGLLWLLVGGLFYTCGAGIYSMKKLVIVPGVFGNHELWHLFVSAGAAAHYILIVSFVAKM
jgi:hemolysin III